MKVGRNNKCPCNSGMKYKHCCLYRRHGGQQIIEKFRTSLDARKEIVKRLISINHEKRMKEIIEGKTNE